MARYMQRAENLARIIDVNETFARDSRGERDWLPVLKLHRDEESFMRRYRIVDGPRVVRFYVIDVDNSNSIQQCALCARENARSIRHLVSLELWVQLNVFHNWVSGLTSRSLRVAELSRLCSRIKEACQLHLGIVESTLYRDQIYSFYKLGQLVELCDQTTRLVDIKYHTLLPAAHNVGTPLDVAQWNALLRSASAYHGYRRVFPHEMTPTSVAGFILLDSDFPRSIRHCARQLTTTLRNLMSRSDFEGMTFDETHLEKLQEMSAMSPEAIISLGLNQYLDGVQVTLIALGNQIARQFFLAQYAAADAFHRVQGGR
jgi:uncharacterized alpha-E superfamily protein